MTASVDALIRDLGADLKPVRRLRPPLMRTCGWLALVAAIGLLLAAFADLRSVALRLGAAPDMWLAVTGSTLTTVLAAIAAFQLSLPDRRTGWVLLPVPALLLWIAASGLGCLRTWVLPDVQPALMRETGDCFTFIVGLSIPLSIVMVVMIRRACPLRPNLTAATSGLAVAAGAATLLNFCHPYDASASDLAVHLVAVVLVVGVNRIAGGRLLTAGPIRPSR